MQRYRTSVLVVTALVIGFFAARWCAAQSASQPAGKDSATDYYVGLSQYESFIRHLNETKQTNTIKRFVEYSTVTVATQNSADLGRTLAILQRFRDGRTNEALALLEGKLNIDVFQYVTCYRDLPAETQSKMGLTLIKQARDYRAKYPFKHRYASVDEGVAEAFKILDEKGVK